MKRAVGAEWPRVLCPEPGCYPPAAAPRRTERVLHISRHAGQIGALGLDTVAAAYRQVCYLDKLAETTLDEACREAALIRPSLVVIQAQQAGVIEPEGIAVLRRCCAADAVIVNCDWDQHHESWEYQRAWFVELGRVIDASLVANTWHPYEYAARGVRHAGYLAIGVDPTMYSPPTVKRASLPPVLLANCVHPVHDRRTAIAHELLLRLGPLGLAIYGSGWSGLVAQIPVVGRDEADVHGSAPATICISARHDLARYTSDRLFRALASGGVAFVERIPDVEGLGLVDGVNCRLWSSLDELEALCLQNLAERDRQAMRAAAVELSRDHVWSARALELLAIVDTVREARR